MPPRGVPELPESDLASLAGAVAARLRVGAEVNPAEEPSRGDASSALVPPVTQEPRSRPASDEGDVLSEPSPSGTTWASASSASSRRSWDPPAGQPRPGDDRCFTCLGIGHWARDCPLQRRGGSVRYYAVYDSAVFPQLVGVHQGTFAEVALRFNTGLGRLADDGVRLTGFDDYALAAESWELRWPGRSADDNYYPHAFYG